MSRLQKINGTIYFHNRNVVVTWWRDSESNRGHEALQATALPTELSRLVEITLLSTEPIIIDSLYIHVISPLNFATRKNSLTKLVNEE